MTTLNIADREMLFSLLWYMSARQSALRAALSFRTQLSVADQMDVRVHYSGYFLNLVAAIELFRETPAPRSSDFERLLYSRLVFDGFQDGKANYDYIRELRNAIVHRGLDITKAAHCGGTRPMFLSESHVKNQRGTKTFLAFDMYLLRVIAKCESVVGPVMLESLNAVGIFEAPIDAQSVVAEARESIEQSQALPEHVKAQAMATELQSRWVEAAHKEAMAKLREALAPCAAI